MRRRRGLRAHLGGEAAEEIVARHYTARGATIAATRHRNAQGEIDLIVEIDNTWVFVEVKQRRHQDNSASPISDRQWKRLENAALFYISTVVEATGVHPACRFDAALVGPDGTVTIIENARSFDEH